MNRIIDYLQITSKHYLNLKFETYFQWCDMYASNDQQFQSMFANTALFNWWNQEYSRLEAEYLEDYDPYFAKMDVKDLLDQYENRVFKIFNYYSKPLIKQARKQNLIPQFN